MKPTNLLIGIMVALIVILGLTSVYVIDEGKNAIVLRLGKIVHAHGKPFVAKPGLHIRSPLIDNVRVFDARIQELATSPSQPLTVVTKEQTYLVVEYFAKWRITDLPRFYTSTGAGDLHHAEVLLEQRINDIVRAEYGKYTSAQSISFDRAAMVAAIKEQASHVGKDQGVDVIDVQIQQVTLPKDVMDSVFKRMETERKQFAEAKRAEGLKKSEEIKALADQRVTVIKSQALMEAAKVRALGDQEAAAIYAKAYSADPRFYAFYRSLQAYEKSFSQKSDVLVLKPEGEFFNYFNAATH